MKIENSGVKRKKAKSRDASHLEKKAAAAESGRLKIRSALDVDITGMDDEGYGIAAFNSQPLRIAGGMPGDRVTVIIDHVARRIVFGHVIKILTPSTRRSGRPPCRVSGHCLGCPLIRMKYREQLELKREMVRKELLKYSSLADVHLHPLLHPERKTHYRNTARLVIAGKHSDPYIGIYRRSSHDVFDLVDCPLHHPLVNRVIETVRKGIKKLKVPIYNPRSGMGLLRYLVVRISEAEGSAMAVFVTSRRSYNEIHHLGGFLMDELPEISVIVQNVNSSDGNVIMGNVDHFRTAKHHLTERIGEISLMISPRSFFQVNREGATLIYTKVSEMAKLTGVETVIDLYCGIGGIALTLAGAAAKVIGMEVVDSAVEDAIRNAALNRIGNCAFEAGDVSELLEELVESGARIDLAVLNPPRKGCDEAVLKHLATLSPGRIIYVSCSPATLAGDLSRLSCLGYLCREIQPVDMFPQTMHLESIALLERG